MSFYPYAFSQFSSWLKKPTVPEVIPETPSRIAHCEPVKHTDHFKIVVILDESGSMDSIRQPMIEALNGLIQEQKQVKARPCHFTLVKFNSRVQRVIENRDLQEVSMLTLADYAPSESTALYDAIGDTIDWFRYERDVLLVIITDGQENASTRYRKKAIIEMLDEKQKYCNWSYVYLCNDLSTSAQGDSIGLNTSKNVTNCCVKQDEYKSFIGKNLNFAIGNYRTKGVSVQSQLNRGA